MRFSTVVASVLPIVAVYAVDHLVTVGDGGLLAYNPTNVTAAQGDTVTFEFRAKNHTVTQSTFATPCTPSADGVNSGFVPIANGSTQFAQWQIQIDNTSAPLWFFCAQTNPVSHCGSGMVFAVNPTADKSYETFQATANATLDATTTGSSAAAGSSSAAGSTASGAVVSSAAAGASAAVQTNAVSSIAATATGVTAVSATVAAAAASSSTASASGATGTGNGAIGLGARGSAGAVLAFVGLVVGLTL